jgi:hypothetical protein
MVSGRPHLGKIMTMAYTAGKKEKTKSKWIVGAIVEV